MLPMFWNQIWEVAAKKMVVQGGPAIMSAFEKTGWSPYNRYASNYPRHIYDVSRVTDPTGSEKLVASAPEVTIETAVHTDRYVLMMAADEHKGETRILREQSIEYFRTSVQEPAAEAAEIWKKARLWKMGADERDPLATDLEGLNARTQEVSMTATGNWGQAGESFGQYKVSFDKKVAKADKEKGKKKLAADKARLKVVRACAAAAVAEAKLLSGDGQLAKLGVQELKDLLVGRGGKPQGNKAKLIEMLKQDYSQPQAAAAGTQAAAEARTLEATLLSAQAAAEAEGAPGAAGTEAEGWSMANAGAPMEVVEEAAEEAEEEAAEEAEEEAARPAKRRCSARARRQTPVTDV